MCRRPIIVTSVVAALIFLSSAGGQADYAPRSSQELRVTKTVVERGDRIVVVSPQACPPGSRSEVTLISSRGGSRVLGHLEGGATSSFRIPADVAAGPYTLSTQCLGEARTARVQVAAAAGQPLPRTGAPVVSLLLTGLMLIWIGVVLLLAFRPGGKRPGPLAR